MNRMVLTKLLKDIIDLYIEDKFTYIWIIDTLSKIPKKEANKKTKFDKKTEYDEDRNYYIQAELIKNLFDLFPYYRLLSDLKDLGDYIMESTKANPNFKNISKILNNGCLGDMVPDIKKRIQIETMVHLNELLYIYINGELTPDLVINHLTKNMFDSRVLTAMDTAESINYEQTTMPEFTRDQISLREMISRTYYNRKESVRRNLEEYTINNFDEASLEDFMMQVLNIIDNSSLPDKDLLKNTIDETLMDLYTKVSVIWFEKKEQALKEAKEEALRAERGENYQLSLTFD